MFTCLVVNVVMCELISWLVMAVCPAQKYITAALKMHALFQNVMFLNVSYLCLVEIGNI